MNTHTAIKQNVLLDALSEEELTRIKPHLELVEVKSGEMLYGTNQPLDYVYFPTTAVISLQRLWEDDSADNITVVGNEGIVGISLFIFNEPALNRSIVQNAGFTYRIRGERLVKEFFESIGMQQLLLSYTRALLTQMAAISRNSYNASDQQLSRD